MDRVIFLDRDGTINQEVYYLHKPKDLMLLPGVPEAIRALRGTEFRIVVVTSQTGVVRGYYTCQEVEHLHTYLNELLEKNGAYIDYFFRCPYRPEYGVGEYKIECGCRKLGAGMSKMAKQCYQIGKAHSYMMGDELPGAKAGRNYGVHSTLVGTRYGAATYREQEASAYDSYAETPIGTARYIIDKEQ